MPKFCPQCYLSHAGEWLWYHHYCQVSCAILFRNSSREDTVCHDCSRNLWISCSWKKKPPLEKYFQFNHVFFTSRPFVILRLLRYSKNKTSNSEIPAIKTRISKHKLDFNKVYRWESWYRLNWHKRAKGKKGKKGNRQAQSVPFLTLCPVLSHSLYQ